MKTTPIAFAFAGLLLTTNAFAEGFSPWVANQAANVSVSKAEVSSRAEILSTGFSPWTLAKPSVERAADRVARSLSLVGFHPWS